LFGVSLLMGVVCMAQPVVPRLALDLGLTDVTGARVTLAGYRGDVAVVAFMVSTCTHCQAVSQELEQLYVDYGKRGLRVMGCVFDGDPRKFAERFHLLYPVGTVSRSTVEQFMGIQAGGRVGTPQLAFVDRRGRIRAQSQREGTPLLQQPDVLRTVVEALLQEPR
jgi:peroxiredoxin